MSWTGQLLLAAEVGDFVGVGGDEDLVELGAGAGGFVDPGEHGASGDGAEDFAGQARGGEAGGDDAEDGIGPLFGGAGIKYDGIWLCRGDVLFCVVREFACADACTVHYTHRRCSSDG